MVHELAPAGKWTEDFLRASWPSRGPSGSPNRVADKRRLVVVAGIMITALLHCRICSRTGSTGLPRPPPQHPTSVPFIRKQPGFQPSPQTLTHHTRSLPYLSLLTPQISATTCDAGGKAELPLECSDLPPRSRCVVFLPNSRAVGQPPSSLLCRSLLHCYLYSIAVSSPPICYFTAMPCSVPEVCHQTCAQPSHTVLCHLEQVRRKQRTLWH